MTLQFAQTPSGAYVSDAFAITTSELQPFFLEGPENTVRDRIQDHRFVAVDLSTPAGARLEFWPEEEEGTWMMLVRVEGEHRPSATPPEIEALAKGKEPIMPAPEVAAPSIAS